MRYASLNYTAVSLIATVYFITALIFITAHISYITAVCLIYYSCMSFITAVCLILQLYALLQLYVFYYTSMTYYICMSFIAALYHITAVCLITAAGVRCIKFHANYSFHWPSVVPFNIFQFPHTSSNLTTFFLSAIGRIITFLFIVNMSFLFFMYGNLRTRNAILIYFVPMDV